MLMFCVLITLAVLVARPSADSHHNYHANVQVFGSVGSGGGFALSLMPSMRMLDCVFEGNTASQTGAGFAVTGGDTTQLSVSNVTCGLHHSMSAHLVLPPFRLLSLLVSCTSH